MRRLIFLLSIFLVGAASAAAELIDIRELGNGHEPDVFILFDAAPEIGETRAEGRVIEIVVESALSGPRTIEPARSRWIRSIETVTTDGRQAIRLELVDAADSVRVIRTQTGVRLTWASVATVADVPEANRVSQISRDESEPATPPLPEPSGNGQADDSSIAVAESSLSSDNVESRTANVDECAAAEAALEVDSWNIDALTISAGCHIENGDTDTAISMLERVIAFEPGRFDAVLALAEANEATGNVDAARRLYEQAAMVAATDGQAVAARARARRLTP